MHPNPIFHDADLTQNLSFARERGFGTLAVNGADGPLISHVPFLLSEDGATLEMHLVRSNPIARMLQGPVQARLAVSGPDGYVSPDWYGVPDQVPTWNYVAVHLTGQIEKMPDDALRDLLDRQSAFYEQRLAPKAPWTVEKMTPGTRDKLMRAILPCRMQITGVEGTWKLSQNKPDPVREAAGRQMAAYGFGSEPDILAAIMFGASQN
jgi:transcriptional regulator